jgi:RNA polymerase primary sigma factor
LAKPGKMQLSSKDASLGIYLKEIGKNESLSAAEEAIVAAKIHKGDQKAFEKLVKANLRFVVSVARNYQNQGLPLADLINEGNLGLIRAAKRFDERKNFKFISYAVWWIRQAILQALAEQSRIIKLPLNRVGTIHRIGKTQSCLEQKLMRLPNTREIAKELKLKERDVNNTIKIGNTHVSFDAPVLNENDSKLIDVFIDSKQDGPDKELLDWSLKEELDKSLEMLNGREQDVLKMYFGIDNGITHTLEEIGNKFNLTRERARQIKEKAIKKLKNSSRYEILSAYRS